MKDFYHRDFPDGPVVRIRHFTAMALGSIHGQRTKIPQAVQCGQKNKLIKNYKKKKEREREKGRKRQTLRTQNWKHLLTGWVWKWGKRSHEWCLNFQLGQLSGMWCYSLRGKTDWGLINMISTYLYALRAGVFIWRCPTGNKSCPCCSGLELAGMGHIKAMGANGAAYGVCTRHGM